MSFIDGIETKVVKSTDYQPEDYQFSDGEGVEEGQLQAVADDDSDQEGFDDVISEDDSSPKTKAKSSKVKGKASIVQESEEDESIIDEYDDDEEAEDDNDDDDDEDMEDQISEEEEEESEEEEEEKVPVPSKTKQSSKPTSQLKLDDPDVEKSIRQVLNKVSEGNIEPMFGSLLTVVRQLC